jgi:hypothetical protein
MENELKNSYKTAHRPAMKRTSADIHLEFGIGKGKFTQFLFLIVAKKLYILAEKLKMSYNQINIMVYFFVVPFVYLSLLDSILGFHYLILILLFSSVIKLSLSRLHHYSVFYNYCKFSIIKLYI